MNCRKCRTPTMKRTHDGPKRGKTVWYAWWFRCGRCGWMFMPKEARRGEIAATQSTLVVDPNFVDDGLPPWI